jgi:amino-acid N-acetyltransferase
MLTTQTRAGGSRALIRGATVADLPAVERLLTESSLPLDGVREALSAFLVAESGGALVGVAGLEVCCEHALLRSVAVVPAWRSKGLGRELVTRIIADAESRGIHALYLLTTTADRYFPSFGFERITRDQVPADVQATREFQGACPDSATVMRRPTHRSSEATPA